MQLRRITVSLDEVLEHALDGAPKRLGLEKGAADSERLRAYARLGYLHTLEDELDDARLLTYRSWAGETDTADVARAAPRRAAARGVHEDE